MGFLRFDFGHSDHNLKNAGNVVKIDLNDLPRSFLETEKAAIQKHKKQRARSHQLCQYVEVVW